MVSKDGGKIRRDLSFNFEVTKHTFGLAVVDVASRAHRESVCTRTDSLL